MPTCGAQGGSPLLLGRENFRAVKMGRPFSRWQVREARYSWQRTFSLHNRGMTICCRLSGEGVLFLGEAGLDVEERPVPARDLVSIL